MLMAIQPPEGLAQALQDSHEYSIFSCEIGTDGIAPAAAEWWRRRLPMHWSRRWICLPYCRMAPASTPPRTGSSYSCPPVRFRSFALCTSSWHQQAEALHDNDCSVYCASFKLPKTEMCHDAPTLSLWDGASPAQRSESVSDNSHISGGAVQPSTIPEFGIRYGIQIGQAFGYDFGLGIVRDLCFVSFVIV